MLRVLSVVCFESNTGLRESNLISHRRQLKLLGGRVQANLGDLSNLLHEKIFLFNRKNKRKMDSRAQFMSRPVTWLWS